MLFYLGSSAVSWLWRTEVSVPLFVSRRRIFRYKKLLPAVCRWALDSGGFSELSMFGAWQTTPKAYAIEALRYKLEIGSMDWAAIQDWMCEPHILKKTGRTILQHQEKTIDSFFELSALAPGVNWLPVIQGWQRSDYQRHVDRYAERGVDLSSFPVVGIGSVCRRQRTTEVSGLIKALSFLRLHGFGFKTEGLARVGHLLTSADSMAWSFAARRNPPLPGHTHKHCNNCLEWALLWRARVLKKISTPPRQLELFAA